MGDLINVQLYGDKPIRAEYVYCDKTENCPFYKQGNCLNCTAPFVDRCKFGSVSAVQGPRTKCPSRDAFCSKTRAHEKFGKLRHPGDWTLRVIGDYVALNLGIWEVEKRAYIHNEWQDTNDYRVNSHFVNNFSWIPINDFTVDLLKRVFNYRATYSLSWEENPRYKDKVLPNLCYELRRYMPDLYQNFISTYPEYNLLPNHIGKYAKLRTLSRDCIYRLNYGAFHWEGEYLVCPDWRSSFNPFDAKTVEVRFIPDESIKYKIDNNDQVTEITEFT